MGTLTGESAASLQAIRRNPIGDATAMPRGSYGQTHGKPYERCLHKCPVYRSGKISAAAFDTRPLPPYNAPLVRANSASAIILLGAFCPHNDTHHFFFALHLPASDAFCKASVSPRFDAACIVFRFEWRLGVFCLVVPAGLWARACACATEDRMRTIHLYI